MELKLFSWKFCQLWENRYYEWVGRHALSHMDGLAFPWIFVATLGQVVTLLILKRMLAPPEVDVGKNKLLQQQKY